MATDQGLIARIAFYTDSTLQYHEYVKTLVTSHGLLVRETPAIQYELVPGDQPINVGRTGRLGRFCLNWTTQEINGVQSLFDMKRSRFTVGIDTIPVVQTECGIAGLLDFYHDQSGAQCMHGSGRYKDAIPRFRPEAVQARICIARFDRFLQRTPVNALFQARVDQTARIGVQDDPSLGLAQIGRIQLAGTFVVGMDLDGQHAIAVEELQQQRKLWLWIVAAKQIPPPRRHKFPQGDASQRPESDDALILAVIDDFPALRVIVAFTDRLAQDRCQTAATPEIPAVDWLEAEGVELCHDLAFRAIRCGTVVVGAGLQQSRAGQVLQAHPIEVKSWPNSSAMQGRSTDRLPAAAADAIMGLRLSVRFAHSSTDLAGAAASSRTHLGPFGGLSPYRVVAHSLRMTALSESQS